MTQRQVKVKPRRIRPRILPRNKYDWRLIGALYPLVIVCILPLAALWLSIGVALGMWVGSLSLALALFFVQWISWMVFFLLPIVNYLELDEEGFLAPSAFQKRRILWDEVESVTVVTRGEMIRATFRWPFKDPRLRFSNSPFTFSEYIRIRHKHGTLYFAAENTEQVLTEIMALRRGVPVVAPTSTRWYAATSETPVDIIRRTGRS